MFRFFHKAFSYRPLDQEKHCLKIVVTDGEPCVCLLTEHNICLTLRSQTGNPLTLAAETRQQSVRARWKHSFGHPSKSGPADIVSTLNWKDWFSGSRVTRAWSEREQSTNNGTTLRDVNVSKIVGPLSHFGLPGPDKFTVFGPLVSTVQKT